VEWEGSIEPPVPGLRPSGHHPIEAPTIGDTVQLVLASVFEDKVSDRPGRRCTGLVLEPHGGQTVA
jgi:hypothetical protein